jgi:8-oxo-dGTP pyrophosphatase MutT (NUDIX family)
LPNLSFEYCLGRLREQLAGPLPGVEAQARMAPGSRAKPEQASVEGKDCREAGVLVLVYPGEDRGDGVLVLTVRRDHLPDHPGQISFPGGEREDNETLAETALREAREEIALPSEKVEVLGRLTPLYIPPSGFCVHPFVGVAPAAPDLHPADDEVAAILRVPLAHLLVPAVRQRETRSLGGEPVEVPFYAARGHKVWGATAMMLAELLALWENSEQ